jgi:Phosphotransferase system, mannose/fructose-specific component IIA
MLRIFLASHGNFASGMKSSLDILLGKSDNVTVFDAYLDEQNIQDVMEAFYSTVNEGEQVVLLSDLYGGSVNQVMYLFLERPNTMLVAGVNLALVLELSIRESITEEELMEMVEQSKTMLRYVKLDDEEIERDEFF